MGGELKVEVVGIPKATPRTKSRAYQPKGGGKVKAMTYTPGDADDWKMLVRAALMKEIAEKFGTLCIGAAPVTMSVDIRLPRPKYLMTKKALMETKVPMTKKPDRDNLEKAILDAITGTGFWIDDSQVWDGRLRKRYRDAGENAGATIWIKW